MDSSKIKITINEAPPGSLFDAFMEGRKVRVEVGSEFDGAYVIEKMEVEPSNSKVSRWQTVTYLRRIHRETNE